MDFNKLADLLFPQVTHSPEFYEEKYPPRKLKEGAKVTRFAPSPTGYMHIGNMFSSLIDKLAADAGEGIFYLRIEDTDKKREVADAIPRILGGLSTYGIVPSEGVVGENEERGDYGPYKQSLRREIYACYAKEMVKKGYAYPCFCSEEELSALREKQEQQGVTTGYYGEWAHCRSLSLEEIEARLKQGCPFVLRLRSQGDEGKKIFVDDLIKGKLEMPENTQDAVIIKTDGIPPYAFAHAVDDHLMRTTHVVRGDEWVSSLPLHIQIFQYLGFKPPKYVHISPIMKLDEGNRRKLSKRKDPEAAVSFYEEAGYPSGGVVEYLLGIANSNFEDWRRANPTADIKAFPFNFKKMSGSGALFDLQKLNDVCKNVISLMTADEVYSEALAWAEKYDTQLADLLKADEQFSKGIFAIDRGGKKPRKDIASWQQVRAYAEYFFDELWDSEQKSLEGFDRQTVSEVVSAYIGIYDPSLDKDAWFEQLKSLCTPLGFSPNVKEYKAEPSKFKGHVGDVSTIIRVAVTGRTNTPDLCSIMKLLGKDKVIKRLQRYI